MQLPQSLTLESAAAALGVLSVQPSGASGEPFTIDASALRVFDSAALAVLLHARRLAQSRGQAMRVHGASPKLTQLAQLYGVAELLGLTPAA